MTHSVIRLTELRLDPASTLGYAPTDNHLLLTGSDDEPLTGRLYTTPIVRAAHAPEGSGAPATAAQRALAKEKAPDADLVVERVHGEITLSADLDVLRWLCAVRGEVISVEVWQGFADVFEDPAWNEAGIRLLHLRDIFTAFTGDVLWFEAPDKGDATVGPVVTDWGYYQRMTTTPPPQAGDPVVL